MKIIYLDEIDKNKNSLHQYFWYSNLKKYIKSIRNKEKREYAHAMALYLTGHGPHPEYKCSCLAAQAVRHTLCYDIIPEEYQKN